MELLEYKCYDCGFLAGRNSYMYVIDENGDRVVCPHPSEVETIREVLKVKVVDEAAWKKVGFNADCICLDCKRKFQLDLGEYKESEDEYDKIIYIGKGARDERKCKYCGSKNVKAAAELVGESCPKCGRGRIEIKHLGIS